VRSVSIFAALVLAAGASACTPINRPDLNAMLTAREHSAKGKPSRGSYDALIAQHAAANGVPVSLARAVVAVESGGNAKARGRGTVGLMQIKPSTARGIGYRGSTAGLYEPNTNLKWGMRYLGEAYRLGGGDTCATALRYQGGHGAKRMTASARSYCAKVKAKMARS
jgi:soluble lytic murein transglycosylase-like protein